MFSPPNENLDDFIEKPSQKCSAEELKMGVESVSKMLDKNPAAIMSSIANHSYIPASYLLADLVDKMKSQKCLKKLEILFDKCLDELVEACVYNRHDLARCLDAMPSYSDKVMENILSHEHRIKRMLEADRNPKETLEEICSKHPAYSNQFSEYYHKHLCTTPGLK